MKRFLRRLAATLLLAGVLGGPVQAQSDLHDVLQKGAGKGPPVPQYALAMIAVMMVLSIVCYPSRKW